MEQISKDDFLSFLKACPTPWHTVARLEQELVQKGFVELEEKRSWKLEMGLKYFVKRGGALFAFTLPKKSFEKLFIHLSHTDSPALKVKEQPKKSAYDYQTIGVELYGSPLLYTWAASTLIPAGIVQLAEGKSIEERLVYLEEASSFLAPLAIHLDRDANSKGVVFNKQQDLNPIFSLKEPFFEYLKKKFGKSYLSADLFLVPREFGEAVGLHEPFISSYRIDNLSSVYASLKALVSSEVTSSTVHMALFFDHEEVGSSTAEGAYSKAFDDILSRILLAFSLESDLIYRLKASSFCLSCDVAHGLHPNFSNKHDLEAPPVLGKGVVIKHSAQKRYATDSRSKAKLKFFTLGKVPLQEYYPHGEIPTGSTVGPIFSHLSGIETIDIGIPILGMHSIKEMMAKEDLDALLFLIMSTYHQFNDTQSL